MNENSALSFADVYNEVRRGAEFDRYAGVLDIIKQLAPQLPTWDGVDLSSSRAILARFVSFRVARELMIAAFADHVRQCSLAAHEVVKFIEPFSEFVALTQPLADKNQARQISRIFSDSMLMKYIDQQPLSVERKKVRELDGPADQIDYYIVGPTSPEKVKAATDAFARAWTAIIGTNQPKRCQVLILESESIHPRSQAMMMTTPLAIVNLSDPEYEATAFHEAVHAAFGAESGQPFSHDFVEGCATKITDAHLPGSRQKPWPNLVSQYKLLLQTQNPAASSTAWLEGNRQVGLPLNDLVIDISKYVFGYFFIQELFKNSIWQRLGRQWQTAHPDYKGKYGLLHELNRAFVENGVKDGQIIPNRENFQLSLRQIGFTDSEIHDLVVAINQAIRDYPAS